MTVDTKVITSVSDISKLGIVDFNRLNGYWDNDVTRAVEVLNIWIVGHANITVIHDDLTKYPERDDWPGWNHAGNHAYYGRLYWNMFYHHFGEYGSWIKFTDSPDFSGQLIFPDEGMFEVRGDIGKVSASTFIFTLMSLNTGDLWISVLDENTQVIIEMCADVQRVYMDALAERLGFNARDNISVYKAMEVKAASET